MEGVDSICLSYTFFKTNVQEDDDAVRLFAAAAALLPSPLRVPATTPRPSHCRCAALGSVDAVLFADPPITAFCGRLQDDAVRVPIKTDHSTSTSGKKAQLM